MTSSYVTRYFLEQALRKMPFLLSGASECFQRFTHCFLGGDPGAVGFSAPGGLCGLTAPPKFPFTTPDPDGPPMVLFGRVLPQLHSEVVDPKE